jgi:undecaprenyl-diphosphatase
MQKQTEKKGYPEFPLKNIQHTISAFSFELLAFFSLLIFSLSLIYFLVHSVIPEKQNMIDHTAFILIQPYISEKYTLIAQWVTFFGTGSFLIPAYLFIFLYLLRNNFIQYAVMVVVMVMSSLLLGWILKPMFHRSRPPFPLVSGAGGYSFPSGHALGGFIFSGVLLFLVWKTGKNIYQKYMISFFVISFGLGIGLSRIYLHVHYATDVMGSLFITLAWFSLSYIFFHLIFKHEMREKLVFYNSSQERFSIGCIL